MGSKQPARGNSAPRIPSRVADPPSKKLSASNAGSAALLNKNILMDNRDQMLVLKFDQKLADIDEFVFDV